MVEDRVTDGRRIAQLLASELTGLDRGPLGGVEVVDAVQEVEPSPAGARAYDVVADGDPGDGDPIASVFVTESSAHIAFESERDLALPERDDGLRIATGDGLHIESGDAGPVLVVESGAAVKRAVDALAATLP